MPRPAEILTMATNDSYPHLEKFSNDIGIEKENLVRAFKVEKEFHKNILNEKDKEKRKILYKTVYEKVHPYYGEADELSRKRNLEHKKKTVKLFSEILEGKSILDVGCGDGSFLINVSNSLGNSRLVGIDISSSVIPSNINNIDFINKDIINFDLDEQFDIVFSDNVLEHIAYLDLSDHLSSIKKALKSNGTLIIIMPNRLFGPCDVTRIIDYTYSNKIPAMGTHLNESTYTEMISILKGKGFRKIQAILPVSLIISRIPSIIVNSGFMTLFENNKYLLKILYILRLKLPIILICKLAHE